MTNNQKGNSSIEDRYKDILKKIEIFLNNKNDINPLIEAIKIASIYAVFGILWILLSDTVLYMLVGDNKGLLKTISLYKGWLFIFTTALILLLMTYRSLNIIKGAKDDLYVGYEELAATHEQLIATEGALEQQFYAMQEKRDALYESEMRYRLAVDGSNDVIWSWDIRKNMYESSFFYKIEIDHKKKGKESVFTFEDWQNQIHPDDKEKALETINNYLAGKTKDYINTFRAVTADSNYIWIQSKGKAVWDANGVPLKMAGSHTDITEQIDNQEKLYNLAYFDKLTKLANRSYFELETNNIIESRHEIDTFAIIYFDIDDFKHINDTLGHTIGDTLLIHISNILKGLTMNQHFIARLGGDEFAIILLNISNQDEIVGFINTLFNSIKAPFNIEDHELYTTISMGISVYPRDGKDLDTLLKNADTALFFAKDNGKNNFSFYDNKMEDETIYYVNMIKSIRQAIINDEYYLNYQPKFNLITKKLKGVEALLRWKHPEKGFISPGEFIPIAEQTGLIEEIDEWVLRKASTQMKTWVDKGMKDISMSVNISGKKLLDKDLVGKVATILDDVGLEGRFLNIEITETALIENYDIAIQTLNQLKQMGIKIELDDFGKGYSSLTYLKRLPIDILKIDIEFIRNLNKSNTENAIVNAIIDLAHNLNLDVIAEGIETEVQCSILTENNCDYGQGYFYSKPIAATDIETIYYKM